MIRSTAAVLALLLLAPPLMEAQEPPREGQPVTHTVRPGETLGEIAERYLGSAQQWRVIFEANRDQITDPNRISVGMNLMIPGTEQPGVGVVGVRVEGMEIGPQELEEHQIRRELTRLRPFQPVGVPEPDRGRTVFYGVDSREGTGPQVILAPAEEVAAVPRAVFHAAGWLAPDPAGTFRLGEVVSFAGDQQVRAVRNTVHPHEEVRILFNDPSIPRVGDHFLTYRRVRHAEGVGWILAPSARLEIVRVDEAGSIGRVVAEYDRLQLGHLVTRMRTFPLSVGVHPTETDIQLDATVLTFQDRKELYLPGDYAFIDRGERDGLAVGDQFVAVGGDEGGWQGQVVGRVQVVGVLPGTATVRILRTDAPHAMRPGLRLMLDRKMP